MSALPGLAGRWGSVWLHPAPLSAPEVGRLAGARLGDPRPGPSSGGAPATRSNSTRTTRSLSLMPTRASSLTTGTLSSALWSDPVSGPHSSRYVRGCPASVSPLPEATRLASAIEVRPAHTARPPAQSRVQLSLHRPGPLRRAMQAVCPVAAASRDRSPRVPWRLGASPPGRGGARPIPIPPGTVQALRIALLASDLNGTPRRGLGQDLGPVGDADGQPSPRDHRCELCGSWRDDRIRRTPNVDRTAQAAPRPLERERPRMSTGEPRSASRRNGFTEAS